MTGIDCIIHPKILQRNYSSWRSNHFHPARGTFIQLLCFVQGVWLMDVSLPARLLPISDESLAVLPIRPAVVVWSVCDVWMVQSTVSLLKIFVYNHQSSALSITEPRSLMVRMHWNKQNHRNISSLAPVDANRPKNFWADNWPQVSYQLSVTSMTSLSKRSGCERFALVVKTIFA